ncbi:H-type small acid-soluble spore protein [Lentibacillus sp. JNUCC-1]|uniref:H-type small acid-soluble spore protein n=1 Tax=Lentibacillus sp. JNUCC-1 TaxID=2654513 RepID=UPI0012E93AAE|nr:H-type small acid-soluble spore protein [Lentibacillus sp. JNUCC-1]
MNVERASEIVESGDLIRVNYDGQQIFIQHVDESAKVARVYALDDPSDEFEVNIEELNEG